jgi:hypothetical protein
VYTLLRKEVAPTGYALEAHVIPARRETPGSEYNTRIRALKERLIKRPFRADKLAVLLILGGSPQTHMNHPFGVADSIFPNQHLPSSEPEHYAENHPQQLYPEAHYRIVL